MVYPLILLIHNALRWLVLVSLVAALISNYWGWIRFRRSTHRTVEPRVMGSQTLRVVATSIAHTQLLAGFYLYVISPIVKYYWSNKPGFKVAPEFSFFGLIHISLMFTAIITITVGSSKAKRQTEAWKKNKTTAVYFTIGLLLILVAIPWPFSPLVARPWVRFF